MAYGGEQTISSLGWGGRAGAADEPDLEKLNRIIPLRYQIDAPETIAPADTTVETAFVSKLTLPAGTVQNGDRLKGGGWGAVTGQNSTDTITTVVKLSDGTNVVPLCTVVAYDAAASDRHEWEFNIVFTDVDEDGESAFSSRGKSWRTGGSDNRTFVLANSTLDLTAELTVIVTQDWSVNSASNRFQLVELEAELVRTRLAWG